MPAWQPLASIPALRARAGILRLIREFFADRDVIEVLTPLLAARTVTDPDVEGIPVPGYGFLQTSPEYLMKRLLAAGAPSCYQMAPVFRHEERGRLHHVEFCMLEWYRLGFDARQLMREVSELCDVVLGAAPYETRTYAELVGDVTLPRESLDLRFAEACEALRGRVFVVDYPADQAVLARLHAERPDCAARFELIIDGVEIANGYWELTDAEEHRRRFAADLAVRRERGLSEPEVDDAFLAALAHGLPDCAGVALGVDRLVMLAMDSDRIDDVITFRG